MLLRLVSLLMLLLTSHVSVSSHASRHPRYLVYPPRGAYKLVLGLAVPFPLQVRNTYVAWTINFQFQYQLPINITQLHLPVGVRSGRSLRTLDRNTVYTTLEAYMDERGLAGRACLLRSVCEAAANPLHQDGLLGEILQIVLSPSREHREHMEARMLGERGVDCEAAFPACPTSLLGLVSQLH